MSQQVDYTDLQILEGFRSGQEQGFSKLFKDWYTEICYFAFSLLKNMPEAEDVTEDCFMKLWEKRKEFASLENCKFFLYRAARNASINIIQHRKVLNSKHKELSFQQVDDKTVLNEMIMSELAGKLQKAIDSLPPQCRKIVQLLFQEGKNNQEVAKILDLSVHTVKAQRQRGLYLLRKIILPLLFLVAPTFFKYFLS